MLTSATERLRAAGLRVTRPRLAVLDALGEGSHPGQSSRAAGAMLTVFSEVSAAHSDHRVKVEVGERVAARARYESWLPAINDDARTTLTLRPGVWVIASGQSGSDQREIAAIQAAAERFGHLGQYADTADVPYLRPKTRNPATTALYLPHEASIDTTDLADALGVAVAAHPVPRACPARLPHWPTPPPASPSTPTGSRWCTPTRS